MSTGLLSLSAARNTPANGCGLFRSCRIDVARAAAHLAALVASLKTHTRNSLCALKTAGEQDRNFVTPLPQLNHHRDRHRCNIQICRDPQRVANVMYTKLPSAACLQSLSRAEGAHAHTAFCATPMFHTFRYASIAKKPCQPVSPPAVTTGRPPAHHQPPIPSACAPAAYARFGELVKGEARTCG